MAQTLTTTGAEDVRWKLDELFSSPTDPAIERTLAEALDFSREFEQTYRGRIAELSPAELAGMMGDLAAHLTRSALPAIYAHLLHTLDTSDHAAGRLVMRNREAGAERGRHLSFVLPEARHRPPPRPPPPPGSGPPTGPTGPPGGAGRARAGGPPARSGRPARSRGATPPLRGRAHPRGGDRCPPTDEATRR